jgi:hypothetical protein
LLNEPFNVNAVDALLRLNEPAPVNVPANTPPLVTVNEPLLESVPAVSVPIVNVPVFAR